MVSKLIQLYPARWRERYGQEMTQLLADLAPLSAAARLRIGLDVLRGAVGGVLMGMIGAVCAAERRHAARA